MRVSMIDCFDIELRTALMYTESSESLRTHSEKTSVLELTANLIENGDTADEQAIRTGGHWPFGQQPTAVGDRRAVQC